MNNDQYKIQTPNIKFNPVTLANPNTLSNSNSLIYNTLSPIASVQQFTYSQAPQSRYQSESTIRSTEDENALLFNPPNYAVYSSFQGEQEKILISKSELISFTQCFAHEKIQLQNQLKSLKTQNQLLLKQIKESKNKQFQPQTILQQSLNFHNIAFTEQLQSLKTKLKQQFQKRMVAEKQYHAQQSIAFQLKKKNQFLEEKLKYQEDQVNRCQQLLKIKEDIIQNFQWEKMVNTARKLEKSAKNQQKSGRVNNEKQSSTKKQDRIRKSSHLKSSIQENSPLLKHHHNYTLSINRNSIQTEINQTLNLSQINFNHPNHNSTLPPFEEGQRSSQKISKYVINKKPSQSHNGSKKKLNISLQKSSKNNSLTNISVPKNVQKQDQKGKLKSIVIKRHSSNQYSMFEDLNRNDKNNQNAASFSDIVTQEKVYQLQKKLKQSQNHYVTIISALERQNTQLKMKLTELSKTNISLINQSSLLQSTSKDRINTSNPSLDIERKYNLIVQKCILLQNQIEKTIRKYLLLKQRNNQLEKLLESLQNSNSLSQCKEYQQNCDEQYQMNKPELSLRDLVTPQFRETKFNSNFFAKVKEDNHCQKLFNNIEIQQQQNQRSKFLDTFEKKRTPLNTNIIEDKQNLSLSRNEMEDVSEIVCQNQEDLAIQEFGM